MRIDVNAFIGHYPFRQVVGGSESGLVQAMDRTGIDQAWISNLSALFWKDPTEGNDVIYRTAELESRFRPVPTAQPGFPRWEIVVQEAVLRGAPAVRAAPTQAALDPAGAEMRALAAMCAEVKLPIVMAVKLEDGRQRHPHDVAPELTPPSVRSLIRSHPEVRLIVTHADREFIEQVHFGSTPGEAERILWDISCIWGPPEDHLALLLDTVGAERFCFGSGMPLRIPESSVAKLDLLDLTVANRSAIDAGNATTFSAAGAVSAR